MEFSLKIHLLIDPIYFKRATLSAKKKKFICKNEHIID